MSQDNGKETGNPLDAKVSISMKKLIAILVIGALVIGCLLGFGLGWTIRGRQAGAGDLRSGNVMETQTTGDNVDTGRSEGNKSDSVKQNDGQGSSTTETGQATANTKLATPSTAGALQVKGTQLCDQSGNPVQLRGMSTHGLAWFPDYVDEALFRELHDTWGCNVVRLAMYTDENGGYCSGGDQEKLKQLIRSGVQYANAADMYVIVDWHVLHDLDPNRYKDLSRAFFQQMTAEFSGYNNVIYEICNEPNGGTQWSAIKSYAQEVIPVIRANDPNAIILVGTPNWSQFVMDAANDPLTGVSNVMYTMHFYAATHKDDLRRTMRQAHDAGLPIFVSEYGICDASGNGSLDTDSADTWVLLMDELGISYVNWSLCNKDESASAFKSSVSKHTGFTEDDLSESGAWVYNTYRSHAGL